MDEEPKELTLTKSLIATVRASLGDTLIDIGEVAFDSALEEGVLRELPLLGTAVAFMKTGRSVRDALFQRKLINFLNGVSAASREERERFVNRLEAAGEMEQLGEGLLLLLDRQEAMGKSKLLGKFFAALARNICNREQFDLLTFALDRTPMPMLPALRRFYGVGPEAPSFPGGEELSELVGTGLIRIDFGGFGHSGRFSHTDLGTLFLKILDDEV